MKHEHYFKNVKNYEYIDVYRVLKLFEVNDTCIQHAVKKLLVAGTRGTKPVEKDIQEVIESLIRWKTMCDEDDTRYNTHSMMNEVTNKKCGCSNSCESCDDSKTKLDGDVLYFTNTSNTMVDSINISEVEDIKTFDMLHNNHSNDWWKADGIQPLNINTIKL